MLFRLCFLTLFTICGFQALAQPYRNFYHGPHSFQARTEFVSHLLIRSKEEPDNGIIEKRIEEQIKYTTGPTLNIASFLPGFSFTILNINAESDDVWHVTYKIATLVAVLNEYKEAPLSVPFLLEPMAALKKVTDSKLCGVPDGYEFWYHWAPSPDCPLVVQDDYEWVNLSFTPVDNTTVSYPEYNRLKQKNKVIVHVLFGMEQYGSNKWNPHFSGDVGAYDYQIFRAELIAAGFEMREWRKKEVTKITKPVDGFLPFVEEASLDTKKAEIVVRMVYADSGFYHRSLGFHHFLKDAIEKASVAIYAGHSGLGKNLNLKMIEERHGWKFNFPTDRYQIIGQLSCRPYAYYTQDYFSRKKTTDDPKGTRNLDILGYAGEGFFGDMGPFAANLVKTLVAHFDEKYTLSYQEFYDQFAPADGLPAVSGDEDNPSEL